MCACSLSSRVHNLLWNYPHNLPSLFFRLQHQRLGPAGRVHHIISLRANWRYSLAVTLLTLPACCDTNCDHVSLCLYFGTINFEIGISLKNILSWTLRILQIDRRSHPKHCCWLAYCCTDWISWSILSLSHLLRLCTIFCIISLLESCQRSTFQESF